VRVREVLTNRRGDGLAVVAYHLLRRDALEDAMLLKQPRVGGRLSRADRAAGRLLGVEQEEPIEVERGRPQKEPLLIAERSVRVVEERMLVSPRLAVSRCLLFFSAVSPHRRHGTHLRLWVSAVNHYSRSGGKLLHLAAAPLALGRAAVWIKPSTGLREEDGVLRGLWHLSKMGQPRKGLKQAKTVADDGSPVQVHQKGLEKYLLSHMTATCNGRVASR
jgi:hypothetical protein